MSDLDLRQLARETADGYFAQPEVGPAGEIKRLNECILSALETAVSAERARVLEKACAAIIARKSSPVNHGWAVDALRRAFAEEAPNG